MFTVTVFGHSCDVDGWLSSFLMRKVLLTGIKEKAFPTFDLPENEYNVRLVPINYGFHIDFDKIKKEDAIVCVDFTPAFQDLVKLSKKTGGRLWVLDHHCTVLEEQGRLWEEDPSLGDFPGVIDTTRAACEIVRDFCLEQSTKAQTLEIISAMDEFVELAAGYDTWRLISDPDLWPVATALQFYFKSACFDPSKDEGLDKWEGLWDEFARGEGTEAIQRRIDFGKKVERFFVFDSGIETKFYAFRAELDGFKILFCNRPPSHGSLSFQGHDNTGLDAVCNFMFHPKTGLWKFYIYGARAGVDLRPLYRTYGNLKNGASGGHEGAGGFSSTSWRYDKATEEMILEPYSPE
jgi:hypothetical protein